MCGVGVSLMESIMSFRVVSLGPLCRLMVEAQILKKLSRARAFNNLWESPGVKGITALLSKPLLFKHLNKQ